MADDTTIINFDSQGFIISLARIENQTMVLHTDMQEITRILIEMQQNNQPPPPNPSDGGNGGGRGGSGGDNDSGASRRDQRRDSRGRFTSDAEDDSFFDRLKNSISAGVGKGFDNSHVDPLIDSINEVKGVLSPVTGLFGMLTGGKNKPSKYERKRDRRTSDSLDDIEDALNRGGGNGGNGGGRGGSGGLGGLLINGGKGALRMLGKIGGKRLGLLGAALGASSLAMDWDTLDNTEKSKGVGGVVGGLGGATAGAIAGATIGSFVPVIGTAIGGAIGGIAGGIFGSNVGEVIGETSAPYIERWTKSLQRYNVGSKLVSVFSFGMNPLFFDIKTMLSSLNNWVARTSGVDVGKGFGDLWSFIKSKVGLGGGDGAENFSEFSGENSIDVLLGGKKDYKLTSGFGNRIHPITGKSQFHNGQDIAVANGTPIYATEDGVFDTFGDVNSKQGGGLSMRVKGKSGYTYGFAHLSKVAATNGQAVKVGQLIGYSGDSGRSTGAHIHYTVTNPQGEKINPKDFKIPGVKNDGWVSGSTTVNGGMPKNYHAYDDIITEASSRHNVPRALIKGMIHTESTFNPNNRSDAGAMGLMQLMPATARRFGVQNPYDPKQNIEGGTKYLAYLQKKFPGDIRKQIAAYNAGEGNVINGKAFDFAETKTHIPKVLANAKAATFSDSKVTYGKNNQVDKLKALKPRVAPTTGVKSISNTKAMSLTPITSLPPVVMPPLPKITQQVNRAEKPQVIVASNNHTIPQNVSDRAIAHAVTGGLGEDRWLG